MLIAAWATGLVEVTMFFGKTSITDVLFYALVQGVVIGILSTLLYSYAIGAIGAGRASLMGTASPVLSTLGAIPLLGESPTAATLMCLVLVSLGAITANLWGKTQAETRARSQLISRLRVKSV
jgi:drug/metabolite transporter (DMT)-like permease